MISKEKNDVERKKFLFCRNEEKIKFIFKDLNGSVEQVFFNVKGMKNGTDYFLKIKLTILKTVKRGIHTWKNVSVSV